MNNSTSKKRAGRAGVPGGPGAPGGMPPMGKPKDVGKTVRRMFATLSGNVYMLIVALILVAGSSIAGVAGTAFLKPLVNDIANGAAPSEIIRSLVVMGGIYIAGAFCTYFSSRLMVGIAQNTTNNIRKRLFAHLQDLPLRYFDSHSHGELMSRFTSDVDNMGMALEQSLSSAITSIITIVGTFGMMLVLSPVLTLLVIGFLVVVFQVVKKVGSRSASYFRAQQKGLGELNGYIEEMIEGQKVVKVFNYEHRASEAFREKNEGLRASSTDAQTYAGVLMPILGNLSYINYALTAAVGALLSIYGQGIAAFLGLGGVAAGLFAMDIGTIAAFLQYTRSFSQPISMVANQTNMLLSALAGAERIFNVLDEETETDDGQTMLVLARRNTNGELTETEGEPFANFHDSFAVNAADNLAQAGERPGEENRMSGEKSLLAWKTPVPGGKPVLTELRGDVRFRDVVFGYVPDVTVLHGMTLYAKPGQKIAFVGSTGAGKTTVTNLINRFYEIREGAITYDGIDIRNIRKADLRRTIGMVLQDVHLFQGSIRDNIRYGMPNATQEQIERAAKIANAHSFITRLPDGYDTVLTADGTNLSQGQRQLLSIARAAVADPPVLILDEATSSIDTRTEQLIEKGMDSLMQGRTTFVIAHRLSTVRNSNAIMVMEHGEIIERGNHQELLAQKGRYHSLYTGVAELS